MIQLLAQASFNHLRNKLTFSVPNSNDPFYPELVIKNFRLLDKRLLRKFLASSKKYAIVESFLRYESTRNIGLLRKKEKRRIEISVDYQNRNLMNSILMSNDEVSTHSGLIFLMQSVSNRVIDDKRHLNHLLKGQLPPNLNVLLDKENSFYAFPHYSVVNHGDDVNKSLMHRENGILRVNSFSLGNTDSYDCFLMAAFIRSQSNVTFSEFSKEPIIDFGATDNFNNVYSAHKFILENQDRMGSTVIGTLTRDDIFSIQKVSSASKLDKNKSDDTDVCHECYHVNYDSFVDYLIDNKNYVQVERIFNNLDFLSAYMQDVKNSLNVYLCYLMLHRSLGDAQELVDFLIAKSNIENTQDEDDDDDFPWVFRTVSSIDEDNIVFLNKAKRVMRYFNEEKVMSLEMWVELHGVFDDEPEYSKSIKHVNQDDLGEMEEWV